MYKYLWTLKKNVKVCVNRKFKYICRDIYNT